MKIGMKKLTIVLVALVMAVAVVGVSFAAWVIQNNDSSTTGNLTTGYGGSISISGAESAIIIDCKDVTLTGDAAKLFPHDQDEEEVGGIGIAIKVTLKRDTNVASTLEAKLTIVSGTLHTDSAIKVGTAQGTGTSLTNGTEVELDDSVAAGTTDLIYYIWLESSESTDMNLSFNVEFILTANA